jgi:hypothetical protein
VSVTRSEVSVSRISRALRVCCVAMTDLSGGIGLISVRTIRSARLVSVPFARMRTRNLTMCTREPPAIHR